MPESILKDIINALRSNRIRITDHAEEEAQSDRLSFDQVLYSVQKGEIIEHYPNDTPYPSCLILGWTSSEDPVHSVWAYNRDNRWAVLITVYRPDPQRWYNWQERKHADDAL